MASLRTVRGVLRPPKLRGVHRPPKLRGVHRPPKLRRVLTATKSQSSQTTQPILILF